MDGLSSVTYVSTSFSFLVQVAGRGAREVHVPHLQVPRPRPQSEECLFRFYISVCMKFMQRCLLQDMA